jgi:hypothetical protein
VGTLRGGAVILRLHGPGGALVLEHDLVLLLDLLFEKAHVVYFIVNGVEMDATVAFHLFVV